MKAIGVAMALLLVGLGALSAQTLDASALERAHKFGQEFKTGVISACTLLEFTGEEKWVVLDITPSGAYLQKWSRGGNTKDLSFDDMGEMSRIEKVLSYGGTCGRGGVCCVKD